MYYLAELFPFLRRRSLPISRDQAMLLLASVNLLFLGLEIWLSHVANGTIVANEWIPIIFAPLAGVILLVAGLIALRNRPLATMLATIVFVTSILVGVLGAYFHLARTVLPDAELGERLSVNLLVWGPPVLGPLVFALIGIWGISAAWVEQPTDSGKLLLLRERTIQLPYSKTRAYFFMVSVGIMLTVISSVLDHGRVDFSNPWFWLPTVVGIMAGIVAVLAGAVEKLSRTDVWIYFLLIVGLILVGVIGSALHINANLIRQSTIISERFLRGAPFLAPMLFANMGLLGLIVLMDPAERRS